MSRHISDIRDALSEARRAYHDSTCWNESIEFDGSGPTYDQEIERAMVMAEARIAELEVSVRRGIACIEGLVPYVMWDGLEGESQEAKVQATLELMRETVTR